MILCKQIYLFLFCLVFFPCNCFGVDLLVDFHLASIFLTVCLVFGLHLLVNLKLRFTLKISANFFFYFFSWFIKLLLLRSVLKIKMANRLHFRSFCLMVCKNIEFWTVDFFKLILHWLVQTFQISKENCSQISLECSKKIE